MRTNVVAGAGCTAASQRVARFARGVRDGRTRNRLGCETCCRWNVYRVAINRTLWTTNETARLLGASARRQHDLRGRTSIRANPSCTSSSRHRDERGGDNLSPDSCPQSPGLDPSRPRHADLGGRRAAPQWLGDTFSIRRSPRASYLRLSKAQLVPALHAAPSTEATHDTTTCCIETCAPRAGAPQARV